MPKTSKKAIELQAKLDNAEILKSEQREMLITAKTTIESCEAMLEAVLQKIIALLKSAS